MSFSVYKQLSNSSDYTYKLVQLPKSLVEYIKNEPDKPLQFKAPTNVNTQLAICTQDKTYSVRQMNHSNTQLLVNDMAINKSENVLNHTGAKEESRELLAFAQASYIYELSETDGHIETSDLVIYEGPHSSLSESTKTLEDVLNDSPIAPGQFMSSWHALSGSIVDGKAILLSPKLVTGVLHVLISLMVAGNLETFDLVEMAAKVADHDSRLNADIVETVAHKFGNAIEDKFTLNAERVAKWFGIETLRNQNSSLTEKELLLEWKASLPPFYNASLDLKQLIGHYCRPSNSEIRYLRAESLNSNLHERVKEMFSMVKEWEYDEFLPYVSSFIPPSKKADTIILKYAKKKRIGKKFVICPR